MTERATRYTIAERILEHIFRANLLEGAVLPAERELARQLFVSRGMLRESLRLLEFQGVIEVRPGRGGGIHVRRPTADSVARDLALIARWEHTNVDEVIAARRMVEVMCVRELCRSCSPARLERLRKAAERRGVGAHDYTAYNRFHHILVATANNRVVTQLYRGLFRALFEYMKEPPAFSLQRHADHTRAHIAIVDAIAQHDANLAERLIGEHIHSYLRYESEMPDAHESRAS